MTTVVAVVGPDGVVMGADSLVSDDSGTHVFTMAETKLWKLSDYLVGGCGSVRAMNIARHGFVPPKPPRRGLDEFIATKYVDGLRAAMMKGGHTLRLEESRESMDANFLIAVCGVLYVIWEWFDSTRLADGYGAIGSGSRVALGSLLSTEGVRMDPKRRARIALEAAEKYDADVRRPWAFVEAPLPRRPIVHPSVTPASTISTKGRSKKT